MQVLKTLFTVITWLTCIPMTAYMVVIFIHIKGWKKSLLGALGLCSIQLVVLQYPLMTAISLLAGLLINMLIASALMVSLATIYAILVAYAAVVVIYLLAYFAKPEDFHQVSQGEDRAEH